MREHCPRPGGFRPAECFLLYRAAGTTRGGGGGGWKLSACVGERRDQECGFDNPYVQTSREIL